MKRTVRCSRSSAYFMRSVMSREFMVIRKIIIVTITLVFTSRYSNESMIKRICHRASELSKISKSVCSIQ